MNKKMITMFGLMMLAVIVAGCTHKSNSSTDAGQTGEVLGQASWMKGQTTEAIVEHCQMMPSMEGCSEFILANGAKSGNTANIPNTDTNMQHEMNHADMIDSDFDFVYLMIPHHQEAVDTSKLLLNTNPSGEVRTIAENIISGQSVEIDMMNGRLAKRYSGYIYTGMEYMPMMRDTSSISASSTIQKIRLEDMIKHHQGAIDMANKLLEIIKNKGVQGKLEAEYGNYLISLREFANQVISAQTKEIQEMKDILATYQNQ